MWRCRRFTRESNAELILWRVLSLLFQSLCNNVHCFATFEWENESRYIDSAGERKNTIGLVNNAEFQWDKNINLERFSLRITSSFPWAYGTGAV